ncbi:MAG TPA: hypothetical protein VMF06_00810 [Candidatus Limnocylindria bacterium]|jgi:hypothetical protein|nr:hypothetical protein [Candidatus Limnocylindria bacterium]
MNWLPSLLLFVVTWVTLFAQTQFPVIRDHFGFPINLLPALVVYAALSLDMWVSCLFGVLAALLRDSLSESRFGVSVAPIFLAGFILQLRRHLILRDQRFAQFWLGAGAGWFITLATLGISSLGNREPVTDFFLPAAPGGSAPLFETTAYGLKEPLWSVLSLWQLVVAGVMNGLACPVCFKLFDWLRGFFEYRPMEMSSFRPDREIKRGRH